MKLNRSLGIPIWKVIVHSHPRLVSGKTLQEVFEKLSREWYRTVTKIEDIYLLNESANFYRVYCSYIDSCGDARIGHVVAHAYRVE